MDKPLVSVIIITNNRLDKLKVAIESVFNQSYKNLEIIVVDNASNDGTLEYLNDTNNLIVLKQDNFVNGNVVRNIGIKEAKGKYIAFLDDDDEWESKKIQKQVTFLEKNKDVGVCYTGMKKIYNQKIEVDEFTDKYFSGDISKKIFECIITNTSTIMIRKDVLFGNNIFFDEKLTHWQEYDLLVRLSSVTKIGSISEPLSIINIDTRSNKRLSNQFQRWQEATKYFYKKYDFRIQQLDRETKKKLKVNYLNDAISRLDGNKNVYLIKSRFIIQRFLLNKRVRSLVYLIPGITISSMQSFSHKENR